MEGEKNKNILTMLSVFLVCGYGFWGHTINLEASDDTYIVVEDMEDYNDRDDIRAVWRDGYTNSSSGSNLNVSTAVGSPFNGATGPIHSGDQAMVLRYDNDGMTYTGLPGDEKPLYPVPYYSEVEASTVGNNSLNIGQNWTATGYKELSLWFQGHPLSDGAYDANEWPGYTLIGRGRDIGGRHDEFYFLGQYPFVGAGSIQVQVYGMDNTDPWAKAGVMIREKWTPYSKYAAVFMTPSNGVVFQYRDVEDGPTTTISKPGVTVPQYVKLERTLSGAFEARHSANGFVWQDVNAPGQAPVYPEVVMGESNLYVGTAVTSHNANQICSADFNNVLISPMPPNWIFGNIGTNDSEQLYVALSDGVNKSVVEHNNAGAATLTTWQEWNIPLTAFTGVDFSSIEKVHIGLGDRDNPVAGGSGSVYVDNIGLYKRRPLFVDADASAGGDGSSWADAFKYLQDGLSAAQDGDEIHVAQGIYKPDLGAGITPGDRTATFQLINGVTLEGGYAGFGEPDPDSRDIGLYETILSGDMNGDDEPNYVNNSDNSYHVVTGSGNNATAVLDGFTITAGNADGSGPDLTDRGGGIYVHGGNPVVSNCTLLRNRAGWGGGMFNNGEGGVYGSGVSCNTTLIGCDFVENTAWHSGGGVSNSGAGGSDGSPGQCNAEFRDCRFIGNVAAYVAGGVGNNGKRNGQCNPVFTHCIFLKNHAGTNGGGLRNYGDDGECRPKLTNCLLIGNLADEKGGGIINTESTLTMTNCTLANNCSPVGAGLCCLPHSVTPAPSTVTIANCIFWDCDGDNEVVNLDGSAINVTHTDIIGGWPGVGNIDTDPLFVDADGIDNIVGTEDDNLRLLIGSPCIDAGDNSVVTVSTDLDGNPRIMNVTVDMGAYEFQGPFKRHYHVDGVNGDNNNDGLSRETAFATIQFAIDSAIDSDTILVWPGVYNEAATHGINFKGKAITVKSAADAAVLEVPGFTAVTFAQGENGNSVFSNFVVRGSDTGILALFANPTINNVTVVDNDNGVIADNADPEITNCIFWNNFNGDLFGSPDPIEVRYSWLEDDVNEPNMPPAGLVSHWKFNEGGGLIAYDSAGNNDGVVFGATWTTSPFGNALDFDGVDDYVVLGNPTSLQIDSEITISAWIRAGAIPDDAIWAVLSSQDDTNRSGASLILDDRENPDGQTSPRRHIHFQICDGTTWCTTHVNAVVPTDQWVYVVATRKANEDAIVYYDAVSQPLTSDPWDGTVNYTVDWNIGRYPDLGGRRYFNGLIDEVAIYNRALSAGEIEQIYQPVPNPLFADADGGDYHLKSERGRYWPAHDVWVVDEVTSPCIDGGDPAVDPSNEPLPNGGRINMGAYGNTAYASRSECRGKADINCDGIVNFKDLAIFAQFWLEN